MAVPQFAPLFTDHAVLQRDKELRLWGSSKSSTALDIELGAQHFSTRADAHGVWRLDLPAMKEGGPYVMSVRDRAGRGQTIQDVVFGDVWLCSGQSNMEFPVQFETDANLYLTAPPNPHLRVLAVPYRWSSTPQSDVQGARWAVFSSENAPNASAVCLAMSLALADREKVTIGMINAAVGNSPIEAWIPEASLPDMGRFHIEREALSTFRDSPDLANEEWRKRIFDWWATNEPGASAKVGWMAPDFDDSHWLVGPTGDFWQNWGRPELANFNGLIWFRTAINLSASEARRHAVLHLGGIDDSDTTFLNGEPLGATDGASNQRDYEIPVGRLLEGPNLIAIRVFDHGGGGGIYSPPESRTIEFDDKAKIPLPVSWRYAVSAELKDVPAPPWQPWSGRQGIVGLYNGIIAPFRDYGLKGVAWYQGEANASAPSDYGSLLSRLIQGWRTSLDQPHLPFLVVQLPNFGNHSPPPANPSFSGWAGVREAQRRVSLELPDVGLVVTVDLGDRFNLHPADKAIVGQRLADAAERTAYGKSARGTVNAAGVRIAGNDLVIRFAPEGVQLQTYSSDQAIGFEVCDGPQKCRFTPAIAAGDEIILPNANRPGVTKVRYAWSDAPFVNLFTRDDIPVSPFELPVGNSSKQ